MSRSVAPDIIARLEPWLVDRIAAWNSGGCSSPTLPSTSDGKVNVCGIVRQLGMPLFYDQHIFRHPEIRSAINAVAVEQGLKPIGSRNEQAEEDGAVAARMKRISKAGSDLGKMVAEQAATIEAQRREIVSLREQLRIVEETGQIVRLGVLS